MQHIFVKCMYEMLTSIEHLKIDISGAVIYAMYTVFYLIHKTTLQSDTKTM